MPPKKPSADLRTIDMFSGRTALEEAQPEPESFEPEPDDLRAQDPRSLVEKAEDCAVRWLGLDAFHEGDDVKLAIHPDGHAVIVLVSTFGPNKAAYGTSTIKLSRVQWEKLKALVRFES